ncbi:MAG: arylsulfatase [Planctomycetes bacterium]|nr:arylsulfatase [Planctomycetota bacterium]
MTHQLKDSLLGSLTLLACAAPLLLVGACQSQEGASSAQGAVLPRPTTEFKGKIARTAAESTPDFPQPLAAPKGAPNVLLILTDDVGFSAASTFGGPIPTPTFDMLAKAGLRYNTFHTTALCSPTRAALITGRNHHTCHTGVITEMGTGYPGYDSLMPKSCGTVGEILKQSGYNTSWYGKNHNVPDWQTSQAGPFDLWPTALGFEYFYGFIGGDTDQWHPAIFDGTKPVEAPHDAKDYHFDADMADHAIGWIRQQNSLAPDKPFFAYYAPGLCHAPHHAPKEWIAKFKGQFDQGWDKVREETLARQIAQGVVPAGTKLSARPKEIPAWDSCSADQKKLYAHMMEVYAACLAYCDSNIGRVIQAIEETGELDNTLIIYEMGDNGASGEGTLQGLVNEVGVAANGAEESFEYLLSMMDELGGPLTYNHYPVGWAHAMDTPFQWTKQVASHFGGTRNGLVISWPKRIKQTGQVRSQFSSIIDIVPTILEAAGIEAPKRINGVTQTPIEGSSLVYSFDDAQAPTQHVSQYFELMGNRGVYDNGWMANTSPLKLPWAPPAIGKATPNPDDFQWELYHIAEDFSQSNNLAAQNPEKLKELQAAFEREALKYNVYPLDSSLAERADVRLRPSLTRGRNTFTYYPGTTRVPEGSAPDMKNKSFTVTAEVEIPEGGADGVLVTQGGRFGGWGLLIMDGKPEYVHSFSQQKQHKYRVSSAEKLAPGKHTLGFDFKYDGPGMGKSGTGTLTVDGKQVAQGKIERTIPLRFSLDETFDVGLDTGTPVVEDYVDKMPFEFTGTLEKVVIVLGKSGLAASDESALEDANKKVAAVRD